MPTPHNTIIALEKKFWQSMVDQDTETAMDMLSEPSLMVSSHGAMKFGREDYRKMAEQGSMVITSFELSDMDVVFPNEETAVVTYHVKQEIKTRGQDDQPMAQEMNDTSTWIHNGDRWQCVMHTETPADSAQTQH